MITATNRNASRPASAWLRALCAICSLVVAVGAAVAADPASGGGDYREVTGTQQSLAIGKDVATTQSAVSPEAPTVAGCPVVALVSDGSTSGNERGPNSNFLAGRGVYLITAAEASANGLLSGTVPGAIGFRYTGLPGVNATGSMKIYLQNTADTVNNKSTTWTTAITGMTLVHNGASTTLPNTLAPFDIPFSGAGISSFTYTGGALYVAFDWLWAGPATATAVVACNTQLVNGNKTGQGATSPTTIAATSFRPETRLTPATTTVINDASVDQVISIGSLPQSLVGPQTVRAVITNKGINSLSNIPVTLTVTGAQSYSNMQTIVGPLAACGGQATVTFVAFPLTAVGSDTLTVTVPADDNAGNNSRARPMNATANLYHYKYPGSTASGGVGVTSGTADFVGKFTITGAAKVSAINLEFFATSATTYRAAIYPESSPGSGVPGTTPLYEDAADRTVTVAGPIAITLPSPLPVGPGTFFAGLQQTNLTNASVSFDTESPIRAGAFYLALPHPASSWIDFSPGNDFKLNVGVTLIQCTTVAECNDNNACTDDACTSNLCTHTNNNATECDANTCSSPDQCLNGTCIPGPNPCNDNDACTVDLCAGGGGCTYAPTNCDDSNPCTDDSCVPATGCAHSNNTAACSDGNPCTVGDTCSGGTCLPGTVPAPVQFCDNTGIVIPIVGTATPYPSSISVTGVPPYLCSVTVNLNGFSHTYPSDVDVLLARAAGSPNALIMSRVGADIGVAGVDLLLADSASGFIPTPITSGTYKPTNNGFGAFPAPAPAPAGTAALAPFTGTDPNGGWDLWVNDEFTPDGGGFTGWCVNLVAVCTSNANCDDGNPCTNDACAGGVCSHTNNTGACNDNNACTANDTCTNGVCVGGPPPACDDGNACTANTCNTQTGLCENPPLVCNDNSACTDDTCNTLTGCVYTPNDNNICTDNSLCTSPDVCLNGVCVGQNPVLCPPDANPCTTEACNPATGQCATTNNNNPCDDGDICTVGDACGPALVGAPVENFDGVTAPTLPAGWTTSASGSAIAWTTSSTSSDTAPNSAFGDDSNTGAALTPGDELLVSPPIAIIAPTASVSFQNRWSFESATSCFDAGVLEISINAGPFTDIVTAGGVFVSGGYTGTVSSSFGSTLGGRAAWCNASAGYPAYITTTVKLPAAAAGQTIQLRWRVAIDTSAGAVGQNIDTITLADGYNACNPGTGALNCDDSNPCTDDYCDSQSGCQHAANQEGCDDNSACTEGDACSNGVCTGTAVTCNDFNPCTTDNCNPAVGCEFTNNTNPCDDGNACNGHEVCGGGSCNPGAPLVCNDNNACTNDSCNPGSGCVFANNTNACSDGNPCTVGDACSGGTCVGGTLITPPAEATHLRPTGDNIIFDLDDDAAAVAYEWVRGLLGALPVGPGNPADENCFHTAISQVSDPAVPTLGTGFWYLARGTNSCGNGTYGTQGLNGAPGAARSTNTCP